MLRRIRRGPGYTAQPATTPDPGEPPRVETWGAVEPGKGFLVGRTDFGELSISAYALIRYHEYRGGANPYFARSRNYRINTQVIRVNRSPVNSTFGYYVGGQKGTTVSAALSIFF